MSRMLTRSVSHASSWTLKSNGEVNTRPGRNED